MMTGFASVAVTFCLVAVGCGARTSTGTVVLLSGDSGLDSSVSPSDGGPQPVPPDAGPTTGALLLDTCAPNDAPAIELDVAPSTTCGAPTPATVSIAMWPVPMAPTKLALDVSNSTTTHCAGMCQPCLGGTLTFDTITATEATGSYTLQCPGGAVTGSFKAARCNNGYQCG